jgi:hypothetical protein
LGYVGRILWEVVTLTHWRKPVRMAKRKWGKKCPFQDPSIYDHRRDMELKERKLHDIGMFTFIDP